LQTISSPRPPFSRPTPSSRMEPSANCSSGRPLVSGNQQGPDVDAGRPVLRTGSYGSAGGIARGSGRPCPWPVYLPSPSHRPRPQVLRWLMHDMQSGPGALPDGPARRRPARARDRGHAGRRGGDLGLLERLARATADAAPGPSPWPIRCDSSRVGRQGPSLPRRRGLPGARGDSTGGRRQPSSTSITRC
jgi:hypothetical protein